MSLFGGTATARANSQYLVEFKAGKLTKNSSNLVTPDQRKGLVYVYQSDDSLMHFCWKDRSSGEVVDDLIIFPDDVNFKHIPPARISAARCDRIYVLKFKASTRKFFFWMQEPKSDKDAEFAEKVNNLLNNPPAPGSRGGGGSMGSLGDLEGLGDSRGADLQSLLGNMSQQQLMQILASGGLTFGALPGLLGNSSSRPSTGGSLSGSNPTSASGTRSAAPPSATVSSTPSASTTTSAASTAPSTSTTTSTTTSAAPATATTTSTRTASSAATAAAAGANPIRLTDLQSILSSMNLPAGATEGPVDLAGVITPENMAPVISNPAANSDLLPHLPQGEGLGQTPDELRQTLGSPQFQQAMGTFQAALQSGQLGPLMNQFGMPSDVSAAASQGNVEAFMQAMEQDQNKEDEDKEKKKEEKKEDDLDLDE